MLEANKHAETGKIVSSSPDDESYTKELSDTTVSQPRRLKPMTLEARFKLIMIGPKSWIYYSYRCVHIRISLRIVIGTAGNVGSCMELW